MRLVNVVLHDIAKSLQIKDAPVLVASIDKQWTLVASIGFVAAKIPLPGIEFKSAVRYTGSLVHLIKEDAPVNLVPSPEKLQILLGEVAFGEFPAVEADMSQTAVIKLLNSLPEPSEFDISALKALLETAKSEESLAYAPVGDYLKFGMGASIKTHEGFEWGLVKPSKGFHHQYRLRYVTKNVLSSLVSASPSRIAVYPVGDGPLMDCLIADYGADGQIVCIPSSENDATYEARMKAFNKASAKKAATKEKKKMAEEKTEAPAPAAQPAEAAEQAPSAEPAKTEATPSTPAPAATGTIDGEPAVEHIGKPAEPPPAPPPPPPPPAAPETPVESYNKIMDLMKALSEALLDMGRVLKSNLATLDKLAKAAIKANKSKGTKEELAALAEKLKKLSEEG
jgi:hypothetical protein